MPGDTRQLNVKWIGDASSLVKSTQTAERAVTSSGKKMETAGGSVGSKFGSLSKVLGAFNLPFAGAASSVTSDLGKVESAGVNMGGAMSGAVAGGLAVAAGAAVAFAAKSVTAAAEFDHAHEQLQTVVENTGTAMTSVAGKIDSADTHFVSLGFSTTETEQSLAKLLPVTHDVGKAQELLGTAANISRARNKTLGEATQILVGIEAGRMRGLTQLGLATKDATGKTITASAAVKEISQLFGGSASAYASSYEGRLAVLKATVNQLQVSLGNALIPALTDIAQVATIPIAGLNALDSGFKHMGTSLGGVIAGIGTLGISTLINKGRTEEAKKANDDAKSSVDRLKASQQAYADDLARHDTTSAKAVQDRKDYTQAQKDAKTITDGLTAATASETTAEQNRAKAAKASEDALKKETSAILGTRDANLALDNATLSVNDSIDTYNGKAKDAAAWGGKNAQANRDWEKASNDVKAQIDGVATSADQAAQQEAQLHGKTLDARDSAKAQRDALIKLRDSIAPSSPFRSYLDSLITDLDKASKPKRIDVHGSIPIVKFDPTTHVPVGGSAYVFAEGGYVPGPIGAPVGAIVHGGEYVTRAQDVGRGAQNGTHNTYAITVNVAPGTDPSATGKAVVDAIRAYEKRNGSSWRRAS